ncbi:MAG: hypothetical protein HOB84_10510 [Candidatus Marinimicrobia bacterium]|jgi:hypothetical protein|nr:hypothetical protein [Candidatus Neomarinimicrobiota bacterium]MBT4361163.1 hypothetical protein [Candidatus Neomarinimicrobiota bacterium]MBT4715193.1 hypothetical protein [Candidatus Neomarinimicrobiota bacterium]MBT4947367.1 hypothetical protein [Candidatus Neomarinimicrobiota bacterium]MBT5271444.1 hypothetical protein [Candidatus Neomarinimicrobiota bacterium]
MKKKFLIMTAICSSLLLLTSCSEITKADEQIGPGILRVVLEPDPADSTITILGETYSYSENDSLGINIYQGRAVTVDSNFALLYESVNSWRQDQHTYNLLLRNEDEFVHHTVFESFVPPGEYASVSMGFEGFHLQVGPYSIPVELSSDLDPVAEFPVEYTVEEGEVTEVHILVEPFSSMTRRLDSYVFSRQARIGDVHYLPKSEFDEIVEDLPYLVNPNNPFGP